VNSETAKITDKEVIMGTAALSLIEDLISYLGMYGMK
jgi:hypothetical protein